MHLPNIIIRLMLSESVCPKVITLRAFQHITILHFLIPISKRKTKSQLESNSIKNDSPLFSIFYCVLKHSKTEMVNELLLKQILFLEQFKYVNGWQCLIIIFFKYILRHKGGFYFFLFTCTGLKSSVNEPR